MARTAVHINDAGLTLLDASQILYREPGFALLDESATHTGVEAFRQARISPRRIQHRFWSELSTDGLAAQRFSHLSAADLVSQQLEVMLAAAAGAELVIAVPAYLQASQLGLLLGIAGELSVPVAAMVDASVAATRREYRGAVPVHIDISLHHATLARMSQAGRAQVERSEVLSGCGTYGLFDVWLNTVSEAFVKQSRFDPLHTAESEQMLLDRLAGWLAEAARKDSVHLRIEYRGTEYEAQIESLSLIGAAAPTYQQIASHLRALFRADDVPALQVSDRVARLPGLTEMLKARVGGEVFTLEPGATARGALARCREPVPPTGGVSLLRQLPWDQGAIDMTANIQEQKQAGVPTHMLFDNTAYEIGNSLLAIGSDDIEGERVVVVEADMPGVSRRHCTLQRQNGQCVLEDHSRYGTFLNGHRVDGSSVLQIGDALRVGSPGYEFQLITTDEEHG